MPLLCNPLSIFGLPKGLFWKITKATKNQIATNTLNTGAIHCPVRQGQATEARVKPKMAVRKLGNDNSSKSVNIFIFNQSACTDTMTTALF